MASVYWLELQGQLGDLVVLDQLRISYIREIVRGEMTRKNPGQQLKPKGSICILLHLNVN